MQSNQNLHFFRFYSRFCASHAKIVRGRCPPCPRHLETLLAPGSALVRPSFQPPIDVAWSGDCSLDHEHSVRKCRGHGGQRPRNFFHALRKILYKMCKKGWILVCLDKIWAMSEQYVTKCPFVPPYSNKLTIFGLILQNWVVKISRKICQPKSASAKKWHSGTLHYS